MRILIISIAHIMVLLNAVSESASPGELPLAAEGKALQPFDPGGDYLLIFNMGDGTGILNKGWLTFGGRLAFTIKDYIDRKFIKEFQAIE